MGSIYAFNLRYLASVFVDAESVRPTPEGFATLTDQLGGDLLPAAVQEARTPRMGFIATNGEQRRLIIAGKRINYEWLPTKVASGNLRSFSEFCKDASAKLATVLDYLERKAHRLAALQEGMLCEMSEDEMREIAARLFNYPEIMAKAPPFEWDYRLCSLLSREIGEREERTNTIVKIQRVTGRYELIGEGGETGKEFDAIRVDLDINTSQQNTDARFARAHLERFFEKAPFWHHSFERDVAQLIGLQA